MSSVRGACGLAGVAVYAWASGEIVQPAHEWLLLGALPGGPAHLLCAFTLRASRPAIGHKKRSPNQSFSYSNLHAAQGVHHEIYPGSKRAHFRAIHARSGIPFEECLFFDNESWNCRVRWQRGVASLALHVAGRTACPAQRSAAQQSTAIAA